MSTDALWYVGRGTGVLALVLFSVTVGLGIATRSARPLFGLPRFAVHVIHRNTSLIALVFLTIHIGTMLLDPYAGLRLVDIVLPFLASYRPFWLGLGTVGAELLVALIVTSLLRHRIGVRTWRLVHWAGYAAWPVAVAHAVGAGTDHTRLWLLLIVGGCVALVGSCLAWRLSTGFAPPTGAVRPVRTMEPGGVR